MARDGMPDYIFPLSSPDLGRNEAAYALDALTSGQIGPGGRYRDLFEERFAREVGAFAALSTTSGTTALHLGIDINGAGAGDEIIVPSLTYVATVNAIRHAGATPVFADIDADTWCLDPASVAERITPRTRGIVTVHLFGHVMPMAPLRALADAHGLWLLADAAHAGLSRVDGEGTGSLTETAAYSFHLNKTITCGEGGALTVGNHDMLERARIRRSHGMDYTRRHVFRDTGFNYRLSNLHCAILCAQLEASDLIRRRRGATAAAYRSTFRHAGVIRVQAARAGLEPEAWTFALLLDPETAACTANELIAGLAERGIEARPFFQPVHTFPFYRNYHDPVRRPLPVTEAVAAQGLFVPMYNALTPGDATTIAEQVVAIARDGRPGA